MLRGAETRPVVFSSSLPLQAYVAVLQRVVLPEVHSANLAKPLQHSKAQESRDTSHQSFALTFFATTISGRGSLALAGKISN